MPFLRLRLVGPRPASLPRGYPLETRTLWDHIRQKRLDLGLRQRTLAEKLGVREETLATWERGQAVPLARHYGVIVRFLGYDPMPEGDTPGDRLRTLRRRLGLTQRQLAGRLGLDEGTVTEFELERRKVSAKVMQSIAAFMSQQCESPREST